MNEGDLNDLILEHEMVHHNIDVCFPRVFWSPFIVSVHAVFEASILEIAEKLQKKKGLNLGINDLNGSLLVKSKKYYEHILNFALVENNDDWQLLNKLSDIRHAIAHSNGRINRIKPSLRNRIKKCEESDSEISIWMDILVIEPIFAKKCLDVVSATVTDLCERYKTYDSERKRSKRGKHLKSATLPMPHAAEYESD